MSGRAPFSENDDRLLVKYIATYNPMLKGRAGNALYKTLCEDADHRWKWSRTHPWQSWRDRYYKNQDTFNKQIKIYQKKHGISDQEPAKSREVLDDADGADDEDENKVKGKRPTAPGKRKREEVVETEGKRVKVKREPTQSPPPKDVFKNEERTVTEGNGERSVEEEQPKLAAQETDSFSAGAAPSKVNGQVEDIENVTWVNKKRTISRSQNAQYTPALYPDLTALPDPRLEELPIPASSGQPVRNCSHTEPQPVASSSKVLLSPSHHVSSTSTASSPPPRVLNVKEDVFFVSPPSNPSSVFRPKYRIPPKLTKGHFGNHHSQRRRAADYDSDSSEGINKKKVWPPPRVRHKPLVDKGKGKEIVENKVHVGVSTRREARRTTQSRNQRGSQMPLKSADGSFSSLVPTCVNKGQEQGSAPTLLQVPGGQPLETTTTEVVGQRPMAASRLTRNISGAAVTAQSTGTNGLTKAKAESLPRNPWTPGNPFIAQPIDKSSFALDALTRRHSLGSAKEAYRSSGRRIDLRAELAKRLYSRSSPYNRSRTHSVDPASYSSPNHLSPPTAADKTHRRRFSLLPFSVANEDREKIEALGVSKAVEMMAKNFGFHENDVLCVWEKFKNIALTENFLWRVKERTKNVEDEVLADMERDGLNVDALITGEDEMSAVPHIKSDSMNGSNAGSSRKTVSVPSTSARSPSRRSQEIGLKIRPMSVERALSEYSPPHMTRAGQYNRLLKQGREEEALSREKRRASGGGGVFPRLRSVSAPLKTPHNLTPRTDPGRGASSREVPPKKEKQRVLGDEERALFLSANPEIAADMRLIEQRTDVDYMLRWTATQLAGLRDRIRGAA